MAGEITARRKPEEEELARKQHELAQLEVELAERELGLASFQSELAAFEGLYLRTVGVLYAELDDLNAQIAELIPQHQGSQEATQNGSGAIERARAAADLKSSYWDVAKKVYRDLTSDPADRARREKLMADANRAYVRGDAGTLRRIFEEYGLVRRVHKLAALRPAWCTSIAKSHRYGIALQTSRKPSRDSESRRWRN